MMQKLSLPTSEEVDRRLRIVAELRNLCLSLGKSRPMSVPQNGSTAVLPEGKEASAPVE